MSRERTTKTDSDKSSEPVKPQQLRATATARHGGLRVVAGAIVDADHPLVERLPSVFEPVAAKKGRKR